MSKWLWQHVDYGEYQVKDKSYVTLSIGMRVVEFQKQMDRQGKSMFG